MYLPTLLTLDHSEQTPAAKRKQLTSSNIDVEEEAVEYVTKLLQEGGPIDKNYLQYFDHFIDETSRPLRPMFDLVALIESIADTANGRPCSIAAERAAKANPQASPERRDHAESDKENDRPSDCPEHSSDHDMPDAAASPPHTKTLSSSLLPTPPLTSTATTFPHSEPPLSAPQLPATATAVTESPPTPYYITRLTSRGHLPTRLTRPSITDGPIWTRILASARVALCAAGHLASQTESARDQARAQKKVWRRMTHYFDERAGLIGRFRAEGGLPGEGDKRPAAVPLSAEEREEHEVAEAVRRVEEMIKRESSGGGGDEHEDEDGEMRARYRQGMQRFEREERWRRSPSIKWTDREEDVRGPPQPGFGDENRGRAPRRLEGKDNDKRMPGARSPAPLGFGVRSSTVENTTDFSRLGVRSAFDRDVDMIGTGGEEPSPFLTTRSHWESKGKGKMTPRDCDERPGKGMLSAVEDPLDDIYAAGSDEEAEKEDERTRNKLMRSMGGGKWKGG